MERAELGTTGLMVSRLGMGCAKLGSASAGHHRRSSVRLVLEAFDGGVRLFDTADAYGAGVSESILGEALGGRRDDVVLATKVGYRFRERSALERSLRGLAGSAKGVVGAVRAAVPGRAAPAGGNGSGGGSSAYASQDFSTGYVRAAVIDSLRRLRTDRIDLLQFHAPPAPDSSALPDVIRQMLDDGLIRSFGVGCELLETARTWMEVPGLASIQLPFGVLDPQAAQAIIPGARERGVGVLVRGVLGGGILAAFVRGGSTGLDAVRQQRVELLAALAAEHETDLLQLAVWYGLHAVQADAMLLGITSSTQLASNVAMVALPPPDGILEQIRAIVEEVVG